MATDQAAAANSRDTGSEDNPRPFHKADHRFGNGVPARNTTGSGRRGCGNRGTRPVAATCGVRCSSAPSDAAAKLAAAPDAVAELVPLDAQVRDVEPPAQAQDAVVRRAAAAGSPSGARVPLSPPADAPGGAQAAGARFAPAGARVPHAVVGRVAPGAPVVARVVAVPRAAAAHAVGHEAAVGDALPADALPGAALEPFAALVRDVPRAAVLVAARNRKWRLRETKTIRSS